MSPSHFQMEKTIWLETVNRLWSQDKSKLISLWIYILEEEDLAQGIFSVKILGGCSRVWDSGHPYRFMAGGMLMYNSPSKMEN